MEPALDHTPAGRAVPPLGMAAIVIMATGFGWVGGNFATGTDTVPVKLAITAGHLVFPAALAVLAGLLTAHPGSPAARRAVTGVAWLGVSQVCDQHPKALGRDGCEQPGLVGEMVCRRGVRDPGTAGDLAQAEPVSACLIQGRHRSLQQSLPQIASEVLAHSARGDWPGASTPRGVLD